LQAIDLDGLEANKSCQEKEVTTPNIQGVNGAIDYNIEKIKGITAEDVWNFFAPTNTIQYVEDGLNGKASSVKTQVFVVIENLTFAPVAAYSRSVGQGTKVVKLESPTARKTFSADNFGPRPIAKVESKIDLTTGGTVKKVFQPEEIVARFIEWETKVGVDAQAALGQNEILIPRPRVYLKDAKGNLTKEYAVPDYIVFNTETRQVVAVKEAKSGPNADLSTNQQKLQDNGGVFKESGRFKQTKNANAEITTQSVQKISDQ
jgi:hypothetical protein